MNLRKSLIALVFSALFAYPAYAQIESDIVFVTQVPVPEDFATITSTFGNHLGGIQEAARGGDLWIRFKDGSLKNLTAAAGYGQEGRQGSKAIAVRDPSVHWDGAKLLFSMVVGAPSKQYEVSNYYWQLYEITGLGKDQTPVISKVPNQPESYNNVMPTYASDDSIIFVSDRPRNGDRALYPQRDEYESTATNTGVWKLDVQAGVLSLLDHAPSGAFNPIIDSFGRIIYTRWDHLQRDQQAGGLTEYGAFNYASEDAAAERIASQAEVFPEARSESERTSATKNLHSFNHFFPWQLNQDGTGHETINHIGRHELHDYFDRSFNDDPNLEEFYDVSKRFNKNSITNFFEIAEDPRSPGTYFGIDAPEFRTHGAGQIIKMSAPPGLPADHIAVTYVSHRDTSDISNTPSANHIGFFRNPMPLSNGALLAAHSVDTRADQNTGSRSQPQSRYAFRLKLLSTASNGFVDGGQTLTAGISKSISYWDPDVLVSYAGPLWELQPVELRARSRAPQLSQQVESPEQSAFDAEGVPVSELVSYLRRQNLALIVSRNVTSRDAADTQQPFNLKVAGGIDNTGSGKAYTVKDLQIFQGQLVRGYDGVNSPSAGRRVLAQEMSDGLVPENIGGPNGSVQIAADGSLAAFVPAQRALSWQLTDEEKKAVVRERYWLTFQAGEIRVCASCHGVNSVDQNGNKPPVNSPLALRNLLRFYKGLPPLPPPASPPPDEKKNGRLVFLGYDKRGRLVKNTFYSGEKGKAVLSEAGAQVVNTFKLKFSIPGQKCKARQIPFGKNTTLTLQFPIVAKDQKIVGELMNRNSSVTKSNLRLKATSNKRRRDRSSCDFLSKIKVVAN